MKMTDNKKAYSFASSKLPFEGGIGHNFLNLKPAVFLVLLVLTVITITLIVHWPGLSSKALAYDDYLYLVENHLVQNPGLASTKYFFTEVFRPSTVGGYYQPLTMLSLMLDYALAGDVENLAPYHRTSLILHLLNTALIVFFIYALFRHLWAAFVAGLLFGLHPISVEQVVWIAERKTLLAMFFTMLSLLCYVKFTEKKVWKFYFLVVVFYILALLSKPTSTPLPFLLLLLDYWPLKRKLCLNILLEKLPLFIIGAFSTAITIVSQKSYGLFLPADFSIASIPLTICYSLVSYLRILFWPAKLSLYYPLPETMSFANPVILFSLIATLIIIVMVLISLRWTPAFALGGLLFFIAILPTIQIFQFGIYIVANKNAYLPAVGFLMILAWLTKKIFKCFQPKQKYTAVSFFIIVCILCAFETVNLRRYLSYWQNTEKLHRYVADNAPDSAVAHLYLGQFLMDMPGKLDEAIEQFNKARESNIAIYRAMAYKDLGLAFIAKGDTEQAAQNFVRAIHYKNDFAQAYRCYAEILQRTGNIEESINNYQKALQLDPFQADVLNNLAWILATTPEQDNRNAQKAIELAQKAARFTHYQSPAMLDTLAAAYASNGQFELAVQTANEALQLAKKKKLKQMELQIVEHINLFRDRKPYIESLD